MKTRELPSETKPSSYFRTNSISLTFSQVQTKGSALTPNPRVNNLHIQKLQGSLTWILVFSAYAQSNSTD